MSYRASLRDIRLMILGAAWIAALPVALQAEPPLIVDLITAKSVPVVQELRLVGSVQATDSFPASFRRGGQLDVFNAEVGTRFKAGDVIARIDPTNTRAEMDAAKANLNAAEAALVQADQARTRTQNMLDRGVGTQAQYDAAQQSYLEATAARDQASALLEAAQQNYDDTVLRADRDVIVTERFVDLGEVVAAGAAVVQLAPEDKREAVFLASDAANLSRMRGRDVELDTNGLVAPFMTVVTDVLPVLTDTGTVEIHVDIPSELTAQIPLGSSITGRAELHREARVVMPWVVLSGNAEGPAVWVVDPTSSKVSLRHVEIAGYDDDTVELSEGLSEGDVVVGAGSHLLYNGRQVQAREALQ